MSDRHAARAGGWSSGSRVGRAAVGLALVVLATVPLYRLAAVPDGGLAGRATVEIVAVQADALWSGFLVVLLVALLAGLVLPTGIWDRVVRTGGAVVKRPSTRAFTWGVAALAFLGTTAFTVLALDGKPNLIDAMVQLLQARYLAAGRLAAPVLEEPAFWYIQNTVLTGAGWVSQYPPGHAALLATGVRFGVVELVPGALMAGTAAFSYLTVRRLVPGDEVVSRLVGVGVAVSPFLVSQTGSFMSHGSAAALSVLAVYFAVRARDGHAAWALGSGVALGLLLTSRPLFALAVAIGVVIPLGFAAGLRRRLPVRDVLVRALLGVVAGLPFALLLVAYNARFFGGPFQLGYVAAWGEAHGLGFHSDPWGNVYTPLSALAYTSADLTALSLSLFESPVPLVPVIGVWLALTPRLRPGVGILTAWALLPVVVNAFYWHHSYFMGPRMLADAAPPWIALAVIALASILRRVPAALPGDRMRFRPRAAFGTLVLFAGLAGAYLGPLRLVNRGGDFHRSLRLEAPRTEEPGLVFVHGGWGGRVFARLAAAGLPPFAIEAALTRNDLCRLEQALVTGRDPAEAGLLLRPGPRAPGLVDVEVRPGQKIRLDRRRVAAGELRLPPECRRQLEVDRFGIVEIAPLLWQGDLPGLDGNRTVFVRDLGPELNTPLRRQYADRPHYLLVAGEPGRPVLMSYEAAIQRVWAASTEEPDFAEIVPR